MRKLIKSLTEKVLAISFLTILLSMFTSASSFSKEDEFVKASRADMLLYGQIFSNYFCIARKSKVKFDEAITSAANNLTAIIINKHGGLLEELGPDKLSDDQILKGSYLQLVGGAIQVCPDQIPEKEKKNFSETLKKINN